MKTTLLACSCLALVLCACSSKDKNAPYMEEEAQDTTVEEAYEIPATLPCILLEDAGHVYHDKQDCPNVSRTKHGSTALTPVRLEDIKTSRPKFCTVCFNKYQIASYLTGDTIQYTINK